MLSLNDSKTFCFLSAVMLSFKVKKAENKLFNLSLHFTVLAKILESKEMYKNGLLDARKRIISPTKLHGVLLCSPTGVAFC